MGAGLFTFWLERKGYKVVGVDVNKKMIALANKIKRRHKFKSKFILSPAERVKLSEKFDSVIIFGNTIFGISPQNFVKIIQNIKSYLNPNSHILINYRGWLTKLINKEWKDIFFDSENIVSFNLKCDDSQSSVTKIYVDLSGKKLPCTSTFYMWSSGFLEAIMNALGFKLVKRFETKAEMCEVMDIYLLKKTD
jgi:hypothetical protein